MFHLFYPHNKLGCETIGFMRHNTSKLFFKICISPSWQRCPEKPLGQEHVNASIPSLHVPPLAQGSEEHSSISVWYNVWYISIRVVLNIWTSSSIWLAGCSHDIYIHWCLKDPSFESYQYDIRKYLKAYINVIQTNHCRVFIFILNQV